MDKSPAIELWEAALGILQIELPKPTFDTWFKDTKGLSVDSDTLSVGVPHTFASEWLEKRISARIQNALKSVSGQQWRLKYTIMSSSPPESSPLFSSTAPPAPPLPGSWAPNSRYSFDSFIVGPSNNLTYNAAWAVAQAPGNMYNPLFIHSDVGLGKTHLLHAIARHCKAQSMNCLYVTSERFANDFISSIAKKRTEEFRSKYRSVDVLLIDDIQFLAGKQKTQEGFFHTFNDLHNSNRQLVLASDQSPHTLPQLEDRLRSRFSWGLIADILPPQLETRLSIIFHLAKKARISIDREAASYIATAAKSNVRSLEGAFNRVLAEAAPVGAKIDMGLAKKALDSWGPPPDPAVSSSRVIETVSRVFGISVELLLGTSRKGQIAEARQLTMYILNKNLNLSVTRIGHILGGRNHATVIHGIKKIQAYIDKNDPTRTKLTQITDQLFSLH